MTTRLAINELRSARARRERYVGEWLPEPIITDGHDDPAQHAEMADSCHLFLGPIVVGGGKRALPDNVHARLELQDERRFRNGVVHLHYGVASDQSGNAPDAG